MKRLSQEILDNEENRTELSLHTLRSRFASFLLKLSDCFGVKRLDGSMLLDLAISREEMASCMGVATESLIRLMTEMKDEEIIGQDKRQIIIYDFERLHEMKDLD